MLSAKLFETYGIYLDIQYSKPPVLTHITLSYVDFFQSEMPPVNIVKANQH